MRTGTISNRRPNLPKKAASLRPEVEKQIAGIESMTTRETRGVLWKAWDALKAGEITSKEADALAKAANKRIRTIRKELRNADPQKARELIGG
jgi:hypothetical protein